MTIALILMVKSTTMLPEALASPGCGLRRIGEFVTARSGRDFDALAELRLGGQDQQSPRWSA